MDPDDGGEYNRDVGEVGTDGEVGGVPLVVVEKCTLTSVQDYWK